MKIPLNGIKIPAVLFTLRILVQHFEFQKHMDELEMSFF